jgi:glutaredoxin
MKSMWKYAAGALFGAILFLQPSCKKEDAPIVADLPTVRESSTGLSFTFVDDKGNYHVVDTTKEVPEADRALVRVMDAAHEPPEGSIFVADLSKLKTDGTFAVRVISRDEFDTLALNRRKAVGPTLAMNGQTGALTGDGGAGSEAANDPNTAPRVIIYGAEWCGACKEAAAYLTRKHVRFVDKDIEKDSGAAREMNAKLAKSGQRGGGIPVIDVGGKIMVGFSAPKLDAMLGEAI